MTQDQTYRQPTSTPQYVEPREGRKKAATVLGVRLLIISGYLISALSFWSFVVDDAYISARYAMNASLGQGLVYNLGEPVMGYTNPLLVFIETVAYYLGSDGILWAKLLGLIAGAVVLWLAADLGQSLSPDGSARVGLLAALLLAVYPNLALSSVNGLETSLFTALTLAGTVVFSSCWLHNQWGWKHQAGIAVLFAFATMARPEGLGFVAVLSTLQIAVAIRQRLVAYRDRDHVRDIPWHSLSWLVLFSLLLAPVLVVLVRYYGSPIPNTFWAKTATGQWWLKPIAGSSYIALWLSQNGFFLLIPLILWPFLTRKRLRGDQILLGLVGFFTLYVLYAGGDWMPGYRFLVPIMPYYFLLASAGMVGAWHTLEKNLVHLSPLGRRTFSLITLIALLLPSIAGNRALRDLVAERSYGYEEAHLYIGEWLRDQTPADTTVALMDIGIIGFVSNRHIVDIAGLVHREIAVLMHHDSGEISSTPATAQRIAQLVLAKEPSFIILVHNNDPRSEAFVSDWSHDSAIYQSPAFQAHYRFLFSRQHQSNYFLSVYKRTE